MSETKDERLRPRPEERFAGPAHLLDTGAVLAQLRREPHGTTRGHRQETLYHDGTTTVILFAFDEGGELADHQADGTVIIQGLQGAITVKATAQAHDLTPGKLLLLRPGVRHSVTALQPAAMLLTVCRHPQP